jgi:RNAse (barnase) inhibitor barstar
MNIINEDTISGVYVLEEGASLERVKELADQWGLLVERLDGTEIKDKEALLNSIGELLEFPDYYGKNWDALEDCLSDYFIGMETKGLVLIFDNSGLFFDNSPEDFKTFLEILKETTLLCEAQQDSFVALLKGVDPVALSLPLVE